MSTAPKISNISVIIPTLNEEARLGKTLAHLQNIAGLEIIVADGGSSDATVIIAKKAGARITSSSAGRGCQQNNGAAIASGDIFLFLHGDTLLPAGFTGMIRSCLTRRGVVAGAFELATDLRGPAIQFITAMANFRARHLQLPYGDQALFLTRQTFLATGGFPEIEIMEDFALAGKLRKIGRIEIVPAAVITSGRRWQKKGLLLTTLINQAVIIGYLLGLSPTSLASWYRRSFRAR